MPRCQNCNKFVALNFEEPELQSLDLDGTTVICAVRIVRTSECCGDEMKEATLEMEVEISPEDDEFKGHLNADGEPLEGHELDLVEDGCEQLEESGGRYKKSFFGAKVHYSIYCKCQERSKAEALLTGSLTDKVPASGMDDL